MMEKQTTPLRALLVVCFSGLGLTKVLVKQYCLQEKHEVGASVMLYCNITSDTEVLKSCEMEWEIWNELTDRSKEISKIAKYHNRVSVVPHGTLSSSLTIQDLKVTDTEEILCTATCFVNGNLDIISSDGMFLKITEKSNKEQVQKTETELLWLKYLIFSINCLIFTVSLVIFILFIRKKRRQKCSQSP